jgi:hypothetical protein
VVIPEVSAIPWDGFENAMNMIEAGERATEQALPEIRKWMATAGVDSFSAQPKLEAIPFT